MDVAEWFRGEVSGLEGSLSEAEVQACMNGGVIFC